MPDFTCLSLHLWRYESTCAVHVVLGGDEAVLIDFGDGSILDRLEEAGVKRVRAVLMTHHHRDQGQGLQRAVDAGIPIWVPEAEQDLFANVDEHWRGRHIALNYDVRQDRFSLLEPVPITGVLRDYKTYEFGGFSFQVIPTPGHTLGSVSLMAELDGKRAVFSGDLIYGPGKVWSLAATQWTYNGSEGLALTMASILDLKDRQPDILLPSHGQPICEPAQAIDLLAYRLRRLMDLRKQNPRLQMLREEPYEAITPHVLKNRTSNANSYVLVSESGKALIIDYGYDFAAGMPETSDRSSRRPWLYTIETLKRKYGVRQIEAVLPTHYHDDHVAGMNLLREVEGTQVWAPENFARVLEQPDDYDLPCLWFDPIPVDRVLPVGKTVQWHEYELDIYKLPGHTRYAAAIGFTADGKRFLVTGDQYQETSMFNRWNYVYQNRFHPSDYRRSAELYARSKAEIILPGHWSPVVVTPEYLDDLRTGGEILEQLHCELLPDDSPAFGAEGFGVRIQPYRCTLAGGESCEFVVEATNPLSTAALARVRLTAPEGWQVEPTEDEIFLRAGAADSLKFRVTAPLAAVKRARIAADVDFAGKKYGQQAEALVTVQTDQEIVGNQSIHKLGNHL